MFRAPLRFFAFANHALVWISSLIVTGILSYFLKKYGTAHNTHIIYEEVIVSGVQPGHQCQSNFQ